MKSKMLQAIKDGQTLGKIVRSRPETITEDRVLQILNDIAEDMGTYSKSELVHCINYLQERNWKDADRFNDWRGKATIALLELVNQTLKP